MGRKRDSWDKSNRQRKTWLSRGMPSGPSPVGEVLLRVQQKHERLRKEQEEERRRKIETLAELEWRQFTLPPAVKEWLIVKGCVSGGETDELRLTQAVQSVLASRPIAMMSKPFKFWMYCRRMKIAAEKAQRLGQPFSLKPLSPKILRWLMKYQTTQACTGAPTI